MSDATNCNSWDWFYPRQTQDSELLQQLGFIPGVKDFLMLRQVHALEHATVWVLSSLDKSKTPTEDNETIGGLSTEKGFFLYGDINPLKLRQAVRIALTRLQRGDWDLALHPRCGTNSSVAIALTTGMVVTKYDICAQNQEVIPMKNTSSISRRRFTILPPFSSPVLPRPGEGGARTHELLHSRRVLYQLSYRANPNIQTFGRHIYTIMKPEY